MVDGVGAIKAKNLIRYCGSAEAVFTERTAFLRKIPDIGLSVLKAVGSQAVFKKAEQELAFMDKNGIEALYYEQPDYPRRLLHCPDHPIILYKKGQFDVNNQKVLSIVGTRRATHYGKTVTNKIISELADHKLLIVSGLAFGIDAEAHKSALSNELETVGVVAHGLDQMYPKEHIGLATKMCSRGGFLTEFPSGTFPLRENFPRRNRIVAGLADATLVVESQKRGGALITADFAHGYNRDVLAVPGKVGDVCSEGCNTLIYKNLASIVCTADQLISAMGWQLHQRKNRTAQIQLLVDLEGQEQKLFETIKMHQPVKRDELSGLTKLSIGELSSLILSLEIKGVIHTQPGGVLNAR